MLAAKTNWFRAISTFILLYLLSAGAVALILWRLPAKTSLQQPIGKLPSTLPQSACVGVLQFHAFFCIFCNPVAPDARLRQECRALTHFWYAEGSEEALVLKVPTSFSELRAVRHTLGLYQKQCPAHVAILLLATYLFMQVLNTGPTSVALMDIKGHKVMLPVHYSDRAERLPCTCMLQT